MNKGVTLKKHDYASSCMFYLGALVVTLLCQGLAGIISSAMLNAGNDVSSDPVFNTAFMMAVQLFVLLYISLYYVIGKRSLNFRIFSRENEKPDVLGFVIPVICAFVLMAGMYLPTVWYGYFARYCLHIPAGYGDINVIGNVGATVMIVIASVFLAPVCEETVYRGVLFNGLSSEMSVRRAALVSAAAFVLMHMNAVQIVFQFAVGLAGACTVYRSGRLLPSVLLHACANALALIMQLTDFAYALLGAEVWLTGHIAAAVFITLGLFVAGGAALFVLIRYGYSFGKRKNVPVGAESEGESVSDPEREKAAAELSAMRKKDGNFRLLIGIALSGVLLVVNLLVIVL